MLSYRGKNIENQYMKRDLWGWTIILGIWKDIDKRCKYWFRRISESPDMFCGMGTYFALYILNSLQSD